ncbi:hypothetical protein PoHVEF18_007820 [Penicillium ochrochloron]
MAPPFADECCHLDITASRVAATLSEKGIKYSFCGGYAEGLIGSQRVTKVTSSTLSTKSNQILMYVQDIDIIASKDHTEALLGLVVMEQILGAQKDGERRWLLHTRSSGDEPEVEME